MHEHICPDCNQTFACHESGPVWDQEDSDCRWHKFVKCPSCLKKFLESSTGRIPRDIHAEAAEMMFGFEHPETCREPYLSFRRQLQKDIASVFAVHPSLLK